MRRFLIFLPLFPAIATIWFYAVTFALTGAAADSATGPAFMYLLFLLPALLVAVLDLAAARNANSPVLVTTLLTYGLFVLALAGLLGVSLQLPVLGLIGAIPAAACSWLVNATGQTR